MDLDRREARPGIPGTQRNCRQFGEIVVAGQSPQIPGNRRVAGSQGVVRVTKVASAAAAVPAGVSACPYAVLPPPAVPASTGALVTPRLARLVAPLAALGIGLAACTAGSSTTSSTTSGGDLVKVGLILEPANYDFTTAVGSSDPPGHDDQRLRVAGQARRRTASTCRAWPSRGRCRRTARPTPSTWSTTRPSATARRSPPTTRCSPSTTSRPSGPTGSRRRWTSSPPPRRSRPPSCRSTSPSRATTGCSG